MTEPKSEIPRHVAIIMDGNGRWAKNRGLPRVKGHEEGAESIRAVMRACKKQGVEYLTLYAFSMENWVRPREEVGALMNLLRLYLRNQAHELHENNIRFRTVGRIHDLPAAVQKELAKVTEATKHYTERTLVLALSYGGRAEITDAVKKIAGEVKEGSLSPVSITEETIAQRLYAPDIPDPDLMIRTSGEMRLSNFLLWQLSYAEFYITDTLWPDFREEAFAEALEAYKQRHRRYGDIA